MLHALEAYNDSYITYPINTIIQRTDIPIQKNKRNYRKQEQHLQYARGIRQLKRDMGEMVAAGGRPKKKKIVKEWMMKNPNGKKIDCEKETGISRPTVLKWWNDDE